MDKNAGSGHGQMFEKNNEKIFEKKIVPGSER
jgi:hypothetical protein